MDLPIDIIQHNLFNHLKTDKTINRIFYDKDDYYLQNLLCGKLEKMDYMNLNNRDNNIEVKNDELIKYVNYILKQKGINKVVKNISVDFHERTGKKCFTWIEQTIDLLDNENNSIAYINEVSSFGIIRTTYLKLVIRQQDKDIVQTIKKENYVQSSCVNVQIINSSK